MISRLGGDSAHPTSTGAFPLSGYTWYVVVLLTVINAVNYMDRMALAMLAPYLKVDFNLSDAQLGLLTGLAFALFYAICGIPIARWADRGMRRNIIALSLFTWSVMTSLTGAAQNFWHLFLTRMGVGVGEAGGVAPIGSLLCDYVPLKRRPLPFAIQAFGFMAGLMLGMMLAGWLGESIGWRWTFVALGLPGVALALLVRFTLREPSRGTFEAVPDDGARLPLSVALGFLARCRTYRLLVAFHVVNGFVQHGLFQWWPSFYVRIFALELSTVGAYLGMTIGIGSGVGMLIGGLLANQAARQDVTRPLRMGVVAICMAVPVALGSILVPVVGGSMLLIALTMLLLNVPFGAIAANTFSVVMPRMRATAGAVSLFATALIGYGLGPLCVGFLSDLMTPSLGAQSLRYALLAPVCLLPILVIVIHAASKSLTADLSAVGGQTQTRSQATAPPATTVAPE